MNRTDATETDFGYGVDIEEDPEFGIEIVGIDSGFTYSQPITYEEAECKKDELNDSLFFDFMNIEEE